MNSRDWFGRAAVAFGAVTCVAGCLIGTAHADPVGSPTVMVGVGAADTQAVMNAILTRAGYTVTNSSAPCTNAAHPLGSASGRAALLASLQAGDGCIQYSRSMVLDLTP